MWRCGSGPCWDGNWLAGGLSGDVPHRTLAMAGGSVMTDWIGAAEAAQRLGVKQASLYAYVSRGVLSRRREADGRTSMFDAAEVEALARKGRPRRPGAPTERVIAAEITVTTPQTPRYR